MNFSPDTEAASQLDPAGPSSPSSPLPESDQVHPVTLPNGLAVWVQHHPWPPGHVALGLHLAVGSLCEEEDERGYAHFLEHMAFAGTHHFSPEEMTAFFASLGTTLGHHHNATTTLESTRFTLLLPSTARPVLQRALALLADFAFGLTLPAPEVERQRAIILEEMRARVDPAARTQEALLQALVPGSRVARRHPLGSRTSVRAARRARLEEFYRRWYRPSLATLAVVGDVPVAEVLQEVEGAFAPWRDEELAPRPPDPGVAASGELCAVALRSRALTHVQCSFSPSKAYPALSLLAVACLLPPARLDEAAAAIRDTVAELAALGPRPDELEAVRTFLVRAARRAAADPRQLARRLAEAEYRGVDIAHLARLDEDYLTADASSIGEALRITCTPAKAITVRARPQR